jgi:hypothetical protein
MEHESASVSVFVVPEKRTRCAEFLSKIKRRAEITGRFCHFSDFVPALAKRVPRDTASELAPLLREDGAGDTANVIDGRDLALEQAIHEALADVGGAAVSCTPPGNAFILFHK